MAALFSQLLSIWANVCDKNEIENSAVDKTSGINTSVKYALNVEEKHNIQKDSIEKQSVIGNTVKCCVCDEQSFAFDPPIYDY